jgi:hypothetical protein
MSSNASLKIDVLLMVGFGAGLHYFYKGFRTFREYRVLMDTPEVPIRSVAMGLVEIHGKARPVQTVPSPVTRTPCCFYQVEIERWIKDKNGGHWSHAATDADGPRFYLEDASGKVLVDAHNAEYDLIQTAKVQTGRSSGGSIGRLFSGMGAPTVATGTMASDADLFSYAQLAVGRPGHSFSLGGGGLLGLGSGINLNFGTSARFRLTEYLVLPGHWYDLTGTCVENPTPEDEHDRNMIVKGTNEPTFLITWRSEKEIRRTLRNRAAQYIFGGAILAIFCLAILLAKYGLF